MPSLRLTGLCLLLLFPGLLLAQNGTGTCSEGTPCYQGCCSKEGFCGFGPDFCGDDVCISDCDAMAECGEYAPAGNEFCPLNVCCSEFGFCGTTADFCGGGCQNGCDPVQRPSCSGTSSDERYIGYYESWSRNRPCDVVLPSDINVKPWSHLYYSFALIDPSTSKIITMNSWDEDYYVEFNALKGRKSGLKTYISVGGWDAGGKVFSNMARFPGTRKAFITSSIDFMEKYGFDGIDIDWEYPAAEDREGTAADTKNLVTLMKELYTACAGKYGVTVTLPASYWYLKGFDLPGMAPYVDLFNVMAYDIHGTWDGDSQWTEPAVNPHTNLTEVADGLDLIWRNHIDPAKVLLGIGFYGRSFTLADTSCTTPGCPFADSFGLGSNSGGANPGRCTGTSGILSNYEIAWVLDQYSPDVQYDAEAGVKWITWNSDQWIGYDDAQTLLQKRDFANSLCLGGTFAWALDLGGPGTMSDLANMDPDAGMEGADPRGGDSGSGNVLIGQEIYSEEWPTISCIPPCNFIFPPLTLSNPTTISFEPYTTSLEVAWQTVTVVTLENGGVSTSTGFSRTVHTTTLTFPPVTTTAIPAWNWNVTGDTAEDVPFDPVYRLSSSILPPPFRITNPVNLDLTTPGVPPTPVIRSVTPPPYPWSTNSNDRNPFPTVSFTSGPPGPLCTSGCGRRCNLFCSGPCSHDCIDGGNDFNDPHDPDPPGKPGCRGPDCENGECKGELCMYVGCDGDDCDSGSGICTGDDCHPVGCSGSDCGRDGHCSGGSCITAGCVGSGCNGSGFCFGFHCFSFGCLGIGCGSNHRCSGPGCDIVTCSGKNCLYGVCTGKGCQPGDHEDGCDSGETAEQCTVMVSTSRFATNGGISTATKTSTLCQTITACGVEPTITTTTIKNEGRTITQTEYLFHAVQTGRAIWDALAADIMSTMSSWHSDDFGGTTTRPTTTTKTSSVTTTTSRPPAATTAAGCTLYNGQMGVCWSPCDPLTQTPIEASWQKGDPWCYLTDTETGIGALCNDDDDCPRNFACQDWTFPQGGCRVPESEQVFSGGCDLMNGLQGVCWSRCDPETLELVDEPWYEGDPWCWLYDGEVGEFCDTNDNDKCWLKENMACQPDDWTHGGCAVNTPTFLMLSGSGNSSVINSLNGSSATPTNTSWASRGNFSASSLPLRV